MVQHIKSIVAACDQFEQELILYYYSELGSAERGQVESHISGCESCRLYLKEMTSLLPMTVAADEPPQAFWDDYSREMRHKLATARENRTWWHNVALLFQPWRVPVFATTAVVALALTLTLGKGLWRTTDAPQEDEAFMEALPMTENLEFFSDMEVLDTMDLLEYIGSQGNGAV
jgi:hypothetical protein